MFKRQASTTAKGDGSDAGHRGGEDRLGKSGQSLNEKNAPTALACCGGVFLPAVFCSKLSAARPYARMPGKAQAWSRMMAMTSSRR